MRRIPGQSLRLGVTNDALSLVQTSRWGSPVVIAEKAFDGGVEGLASALGSLLGTSYDRWPISIVVSDDMARMWQVTPPPRATRLADLEAATTLRFQKLYGGSPAGWTLRGNWDASKPFVAAGMPKALVDALVGVCDARGMAIVSIAPQFVVAWNTVRSVVRQGTWLGMVNAGVLSLGVPFDGRVTQVRTSAIPAEPRASWLEALVEREALMLGLGAPNRLALCGEVPAAWAAGTAKLSCTLLWEAPAASAATRIATTGSAPMKRAVIDFAPTRWRALLFRTPAAAWAGLAVGLTILIAAASIGWSSYTERQVYEAKLAEAMERASKARKALPRPVTMPAAQRDAINKAVMQLNLPWRELHDALADGTPASVALVALEPDAVTRRLKITAEARAGDDMVDYVEQLKKQEPFADVVLLRHEVIDTDPNRPIRFELEATWEAR